MYSLFPTSKKSSKLSYLFFCDAADHVYWVIHPIVALSYRKQWARIDAIADRSENGRAPETEAAIDVIRNGIDVMKGESQIDARKSNGRSFDEVHSLIQ